MSPNQKKILESARLALVLLSISAMPVLAASDTPASGGGTNNPSAPSQDSSATASPSAVTSGPEAQSRTVLPGNKTSAVKKEEGKKEEGKKVGAPKADQHSALPSKLLVAENAAKSEPKAGRRHDLVKKDEKKEEKKEDKATGPATGGAAR